MTRDMSDAATVLANLDFEECKACAGTGCNEEGHECSECKGHGTTPVWSDAA